MPHDLELLLIDVATGFAMSPADCIERTRDPDGSPAPRLFFAGCPQGNIVRVRYDVEDETAARLLAIATEDPPWQNPWTLPQCMGKLIDVLLNSRPTATGPASRIPLTIGAALIYRLPNLVRFEHPAAVVRGDSAEGARMAAQFAECGMPQAMIDAGFKSVADLWAPWCVVLEGDEIAAIAFTARLIDAGAEIDVYTFPKFRARGYAAAVTAAWASRGAHSSTAPRARIDRRRRAPGSAHDRRKLRPLVTP